jgi:hypothetical protein
MRFEAGKPATSFLHGRVTAEISVVSSELSLPRSGHRLKRGENGAMKSGFWKFYFLIRSLAAKAEGQDLVEYALVVALVGLGGFVGIESLARGILGFFQGVISTIDINFS